MSTKIYNVYKVIDKDFFFVYDLLQTLTSEYNYEVKQFFINLIDRKKDMDFNFLENLILEGHFNASVVLYANEKDIFLQFFNSKLNLEKLPSMQKLVSVGNLIDYHYQDQVDPWYSDDETIDESQYEAYEKEYEMRKVTWEKIFYENSIPSKVGLIKEFNPTYQDIELPSLLKG